MDINLIKDVYKNMSNEELTRIAIEDATGLTPEALEIVKEEIIKRSLDEKILLGLEAQNAEFTIEQIDAYCELIRSLSCPVCGSSSAKLNATTTSEVISFILFTQVKKTIRVACPSCLDKANESAILKTALLGWWGIPWGIIRSISALSSNSKCKLTNHMYTPNEHLRNFTISNIGQIEVNKDRGDQLQDLIAKN